ncbi:femAB family protein [Aliivibrio fischeri]|uniref:GNAT family N-acetyltransferase n=1 Tax=Aliivibrio fischeri TaxID=668 RepID=UPI00080E75B2|nr:GNAT family N-acetyltransferase [Aliivibrio fischeri]OCH61276.1 femAB family protein [Aliivibrio fischeri]
MLIKEINKLSSDIYYQREYSALYEENAEYFEFLYEEQDSYVKFNSLKRKIVSVSGISINEELYDLETPYGYGGPISNCSDTEFLQRAFSAYKEFCSTQNIVCEFIRFHPFNSIAEYSDLFDMHCLERQVIIVNLDITTEERRKLYSKTTRNIIKKAEKNLLVEIDSVNTSDFIDMYYQTMQKNTASDFFYFKERYFSELLSINGVSLLGIRKEDTYASIGFFMCGEELAHYHLSANNQELAKENGNYLLLDSAFEYAKSRGCRFMMLGGGRTSSPDDSLFKFKSKFSPTTMPFFIAGLDFLPEKRQMLNQLWVNANPECPPLKLFQLYRA